MIVLRTDASCDHECVAALRGLAHRFPGQHRLRLITGKGDITIGPRWLYEPSEALLAALSEFGATHVTSDPAQGHTGPGTNERTA